MFGTEFKRMAGDVTNAALNYGYTIIRSCVCKTLTAYGYNCVLGIHHINEQNAFNLADDIMEPFRPLVDLWTDNSCDDLFEELTKDNRKKLINLVNVPIRIGRKKTRVRYAIDKCVSSLTTAIEKNDPGLMHLPTLIQIDEMFEDDEDG
ncbi:MAG: type II CRISPR-associated endonuclease Cas1 [Ruminococcus sp.]|nr:type II CRISPR-associated endonuclease Cas1 [Ruminococcus sp.]